MKIQNNSSLLSFKAHYTNVDIGASSVNGSLKLKMFDENQNEIASKNTNVFKDGEQRSEASFEKNVARIIADFETENTEKIAEVDKDNHVYLTACYPGPKLLGKESGFKLSNFYYDNSRQNRFIRPISSDMIDFYLKNKGIDIVQSRHVNDMVAAGACLLTKIKEDMPEIIEEGKEIVYLYPGGGLGSGVIIFDDDNVKIKSTEIQHMKKHGKDYSVEKDVGAFGLVRNFTDSLDMPEDKKKEFGSNVQAICNYEIAISIYPMTKEEFKKASLNAFDKFFESIAQIIAINICTSGTRTYILTGKIANGIKDAVNNFETYDENRFSNTIKAKVSDSLTDVGSSIINKDINNLDIRVVKLKDNTEGSHLLQKTKEVGTPTKWYKL